MANTTNVYGLNDRQWAFVQEYLIDLNATAAYARAGYPGKGNVAEASASRMLRDVKVQAALNSERARLGLKHECVVRELALLSHANIEHYEIDDEGNVCLAPGAPREAMRAVASMRKRVTHTEAGVTYDTELKLHSKTAALRMAGEHLSLFQGQAVQSVDIQAAQAARGAALQAIRAQLQTIRTRHQQASEVMP